ncbi:MAG: zinc dependent phospholipase C family protein [Alphaproteobacteria bacterium]|nr:zinc dependent phospholipase C family protein [Alphaproteobacteria bacterium]MCB9797799.1 zinc dependent phospholipase C family protein [Alphaproteobacteria bacterium]
MTPTLLLSLLAPPAHAHGIWGHVHVTGWAAENMPDDELRAFLLSDPEVFNALLFGAVFTDTGYARDESASRAYSEHTHWEPFIEDYVEWILENDPPPWDSLESRKRVAFVLGAGSHGLQDSIFDSLFLSQVEQRDGAGQDETDPGTDGFLVMDDHLRFIPERYIPMETVLELYEVLPEDVTEDVINRAVDLTLAAYVNEDIGWDVARVFGERYADDMPWGREHYMDPSVPGSLRAEIFPTMHYQQALWARLHGELDPDAVTVFAYPEAPRRLMSGEAGRVDSWVTLVFGAGIHYEGGLVELLDDSGASVPFDQANTRWGAEYTRVLRLQPTEDLEPGAWYTARLHAGVTLINGDTSATAWELRFQVPCAEEGDPDCPELGEIPVARVDGLPEDTGGDTGGMVSADKDCGCASGGRGGALAWLLGLGLLLLRRR